MSPSFESIMSSTWNNLGLNDNSVFCKRSENIGCGQVDGDDKEVFSRIADMNMLK